MVVPVVALIQLPAMLGIPGSIGFSIFLAFAAGSTATAVFWSRETRILPLTRRELWRGTWVIGVAVPSTCLLGLRIFMTGGEAALVHAAFEFVYLGVLVTMTPALIAGGAALHQRSRVGAYALFGLCFALFGLPFLVTSLPASFATIPLGVALLLVLGMLVSIVPLVRTPRSLGNLVFHMAPSRSQRPRRPGFLDQLSGLSRLVPGQVGTALGICAFVFGIELFPILLLGGPPSGADPLEATGLLPFISNQSNADVLLESGLPMYLAVSMPSGLRDWLRQLKLLPLATWQLVALISSGPVIVAATFWMILAAVHVFATGELPTDLRAGLFLVVVGLGILLNAVWMRRRSLALLVLLPVSIFIPRVPGLIDSPYGLPALAVLFLTAGLALNHRTITRATSSSNTYRPIGQLFGIAMPQAPR